MSYCFMKAAVISSIHNAMACACECVDVFLCVWTEWCSCSSSFMHSAKIIIKLMCSNTKRYKLLCTACIIISQSIYIHQNSMPFKIRLNLCFSIISFEFNLRSIHMPAHFHFAESAQASAKSTISVDGSRQYNHHHPCHHYQHLCSRCSYANWKVFSIGNGHHTQTIRSTHWS